ncbi:MAG: UDP-N-acetylmuramoyl-L-alanyl-D-glutamate--2,6-diaminopimelate ligase [Parasporobacterium sp.]|nr:UDP-N-acetylmuramoyl-L-alanyl-D-glutamate--2,6-diaminopimelate ligase [Parasporobacterium sp.]
MIRTDSRKVQKGDTFVALPGISSNGDQYIAKAIAAGAQCIVCREGRYDVETVNTGNPRKYLEELLVKEYGDIISSMTLIALTGTNGKTTTCYLIAQALNRMGRPCGYIGTIGFYLGEKVRDLPNTSVDICELYGLLLEAHEKGFDTVALEASSQGLDLGRLNTLKFDAAVFTNLTEDHLDYHKTMDRYAEAKQILFRNLKPVGKALVNSDDPYAQKFMLNPGRTYTYGIRSGDYKAECFSYDAGTELTYSAGAGVYKVRTALMGDYNVYNTLAVIGVLDILGLAHEDIVKALEGLMAPDGRCDVIPYNSAAVVIDYAHTPDAVENIIKTAEGFTRGRMLAVFGCTGDREREKRPVMTRLVLANCSYAIITDDDPHTEPEQQIIDDMLEGNTFDNYEVCPDRREAIHRGMDMLQPGDSLLILGKGHENFIVMNGYSIPHNDRKAVLEYINA